jgi:hypothetical protein
MQANAADIITLVLAYLMYLKQNKKGVFIPFLNQSAIFVGSVVGFRLPPRLPRGSIPRSLLRDGFHIVVLPLIPRGLPRGSSFFNI